MSNFPLYCPEILEERLAFNSVPVGNEGLPLYMHYMPWFDTPESSSGGEWGWHWTMNTQDPNVFDETGRREIASHSYPLIGPYASDDPDVIEYHLLLMKRAGVDGVLINWYGVAGTNGDIDMLLRNSNALIDRLDDFGMSFAVVLEDRFAAGVEDTVQNMAYLRDHYFVHPSYIRDTITNEPLVPIFGPITLAQPAEWETVSREAGEPIDLVSLWYNDSIGAGAAGQYAWVYQDLGTGNHLSHLENFYHLRAPSLELVGGSAYPGFNDFYAEGNAGASYFYIPSDSGQTLAATLELAAEYRANIDFLQLVTWNDFGEGTIFEPTIEYGFDSLRQIQEFSGVPFTVDDLELVHALYLARKGDTGVISNSSSKLDAVAAAFVAGDVPIEDGLLQGSQREFLSQFHSSGGRQIAFTRDRQGIVRAVRFPIWGPDSPVAQSTSAPLPRSARGPEFVQSLPQLLETSSMASTSLFRLYGQWVSEQDGTRDKQIFAELAPPPS